MPFDSETRIEGAGILPLPPRELGAGGPFKPFFGLSGVVGALSWHPALGTGAVPRIRVESKAASRNARPTRASAAHLSLHPLRKETLELALERGW